MRGTTDEASFVTGAEYVVDGGDQAVRNALKKASQTLRNLEWFEVQNIRGAVNSKGEPEFQVTLKIGFRLEGGPV